jgi:hypothetical protein
MIDDPIALLERELVEAARRRADSHGMRRQSGLRRFGGGLAIAGTLAVGVAVAAGALVLLRDHHPAVRPTPAISATHGVNGRQRLIGIIAVLRRSQRFADLHAPAIAQLLSSYHGRLEPGWGVPDRPLIRRATVTAWREGVFLIPVKPAGGRGQEGLAWATGGFIDCCVTAAELKTFGEVDNAGQVNSRNGRSREAIDRFVVVVPDGVAKVKLGRLVMTVHDNVAAAQAKGNLVGASPMMVWYGPGGNAIRRIGFVAGSYRSIAVK